ncbi:MAG: CpaF family protein [Eubacterium sp.]|nr:CpaF family protein [Eubacterium sp.]
MDGSVRGQVKNAVMERLDLSGEIRDEDVSSLIDTCIIDQTSRVYIPLKDKLELRKELFNSIRKLDVLSDLLEDDSITEIMINGPKNIFYEKAGRIYKSEKTFEDSERLENVIQQIVGGANRMVNESNPIVDIIMRDGSRVNVVLKGVSVDGTAVTIRKFPKEIMGMDKLIEYEAIDQRMADVLGLLVAAGYNIFISGGTGAGKTTFLNALTEYIPSDERVITIEDSAELKVLGIPNLIRLEMRNANVEGKNMISIRDLIKCSLRMRPDRIIVGEVRDEAAIDMLQAMNTGHDGSLSTGHANSAHEMLLRLESMVLMGADLPLKAVRQQISSAIDIVVHLGRLRDKSRRVLEIREVMGVEKDEIVTRELCRFEETGRNKDRIVGEFRKINDLLNLNKLKNAGLLEIFQEKFQDPANA